MFTGEPVPRLDAPWLLLVPLVPAFCALIAARSERSHRVIVWLPLVPALVALVLAPALPGSYLHAHYATLFRLGFLEVRLDTVVDRGTALLAIAAATATALYRNAHAARRLALLALVLAIATVDDRCLAALGWVALVMLVVRRALPRMLSTLAAVAALVLFWALGGAFTGSGYAPEMGPRVVAIVSGDAAPVAVSAFDDDDDDEIALPQYAAGDHGTLAVRALPGATLYADGSRSPLGGAKPLVPPFEGQPLPAGFHSFRLHPGQAYDDYVVDQLRVDPGQRVTLVAVGPTTSSADARDALGAHVGAHAPFAEALAHRRLFGTALVVVVGTFLVLAALAAPGDPSLALGALALLVPFVAVVGPLPEAAFVALAAAMVVGLVSPRADVFVALAAVFVGAPWPAAIALAVVAWVPDRRSAAFVTIVPRAAVASAVMANGSSPSSVALLSVLVAATALALVAPRLRAPPVPKWYIGAFAIGVVGALTYAISAPSASGLIVAAAGTLAALAPAVGWVKGRKSRLAAMLRARKAVAKAMGVLGDTLAAVERRASGTG